MEIVKQATRFSNHTGRINRLKNNKAHKQDQIDGELFKLLKHNQLKLATKLLNTFLESGQILKM